MTRIDVVASSRSRKTRATRISTGPSSSLGKLLVVPVAALIAAVLLLPASALAAEPTSGYSQTAPTPKTTPATPTTPTAPKPSTGTSPSKEEKTPSEEKSKAPTKEPTASTPSSTTVGASKSSTSSTLPFTGLDLRWVVGVGLLLIAAGLSITTLQRRHRGERS
jgi:uncharacterized membrane protein